MIWKIFELKKYYEQNNSYYILRYTATQTKCMAQANLIQCNIFHVSLHKNMFAIFIIVTEKIRKQESFNSNLYSTSKNGTDYSVELKMKSGEWTAWNLPCICCSYICCRRERERLLFSTMHTHLTLLVCCVMLWRLCKTSLGFNWMFYVR